MTKPRYLRFGLMILVVLVGIGGANANEPPKVIASIKPLQALVAGVMSGAGAPVLLVSGNASPHDYALKPSDMAALETARLVFWMGPTLEGFLLRPLEALGRGASVALGERLGAMVLPLRLDPLHVHEPAHEDGEAGPDLHAWLDPMIAIAMVEVIARELAAADPDRASVYQSNAATFKTQLVDLDTEIALSLAPVKDRAFIVFHDAYQYFERRYGLRGIGSLSLHPEVPPGAKRLAALRARIESGDAVCVFAEPQFEPKLVRSLIAGNSTRTAMLDPLGGTLPGPADYVALMRHVAAAFKLCLSG